LEGLEGLCTHEGAAKPINFIYLKEGENVEHKQDFWTVMEKGRYISCHLLLRPAGSSTLSTLKEEGRKIMKLINCFRTSAGFIFLALVVILPGQLADAEYVIHESATMGAAGQTSGYGINSIWFMGSRFYIAQQVQVTAFGGHMLEWTAGNLFGAIVSLDSDSDLPDGYPFYTSEVVASTVFDPGMPSRDFRTPLSVTLTPGNYALIFGSGRFGSTGGEGAMPYTGQSNMLGASFILWNGSSWWNSLDERARFVVEGIVNYCDASGSNLTEHQYIKGVQVGSINNIPTGNSHYADYTSLATTMGKEISYPITVERGNPYNDIYDKCGAWVDWNQDGVFTGLNEQITMSLGVDPCTFTGTITPPTGAVLGDTRMRIRIVFNRTPYSCGDTDYGEVEDYTITVVRGDYCSASGSNLTEHQYIKGVQVGSINNIPTGNDHYADYTALYTTMVPEVGYPITVERGKPYNDFYDKCGAWVDWNQDGDFYGQGEQITMSLGVDPCTFTGTITPPADAVPGDTRMRVRIRWYDPPLPCGDTDYGEVEDYTITIPGEDTGVIYGKKWHDLNDNGEMDTGEPGLSGWKIFLDENRDGEIDPNDIVTTTDIQGNYRFAGIEPNEYYYVSEVNQDGWINTYPGAGGIHYRIWVEVNNDVELNFGNYQLHNCNINGYKFHDVNNNGVWDTGEGPLSGWEIYIDENENGKWDSGEPKKTTTATGFYEFTNLEPGYYNIMEVPKAGWFQTYPGLTSGRLWGLEGRSGEGSTIAEVNLANMTIENRFAAPYNSPIIGVGSLTAGPSTLFYCPIKITGTDTAESLVVEIDCQTGLVLDEGVLEMPENELAWNCAWHNGILYVTSVEIPLADPWVAYLNRYDAFTKELISRDPLIDAGGNGLAADPYKDVLMSSLFVKWTLYEIDPGTAEVVRTIGQRMVVGVSLAYTEGVIYKTFWARDDIHALHREDGSLISSEKLEDYVGFEAIAGGIGVKSGHRVWIGKRDIEANFGNRLDSEGALSGVKYEDLNGNGRRDANEPGMADWPIYVDLDGDMHRDGLEPATVSDANGNWMIDGLVYGRYFVREAQRKGYTTTEPALKWVDLLDVNQPRDIVFDDLRNLLYVSTEAGKIERYDLSTNQFLSPVTVGGSPHGMDITADYSSLYVADTQLSSGDGVVHKVNLDTLSVTNLTYTVVGNEEGSYDIAIGSEGIALFTGSYGGSILIPLYVLDTSTDIITTHPDIMGATTIRNNLRLVRSYDRSKMWLVNNSSNGWIGVYDAASNTFTAEKNFNNYLNESPVALSRDGSLGAVQLDDHCRIVDSDFNMVMGLDNSRMGAEFGASRNMFYQFHREWNTLLAIDTIVWELLDNVSTGLTAETYQKFTRGETAITADDRVLGITDPDHVALHRKEYYTLALPGRTTGQIDFGNKTVLCGDYDGDRNVDFFDLRYLCEVWLSEVPDGYVNMKDLACLAANWQIAENIIEYDEDFETGDFSNLPWQHGGDAPWTIDAGEYFEGSFSAKSANLPRYDESILSVTVTCGQGNIYFMLSSGSGGTFRFSVDGDVMFYWSKAGLEDWSLITIPVFAGTHTFEWKFRPDGFGGQNAWIDAIRFPP